MFKTIAQRLWAENNMKLFALLPSIYEITSTAITQAPNAKFETMLGVMQGGPKSLSLYNLYMGYAKRVFIKNVKNGM